MLHLHLAYLRIYLSLTCLDLCFVLLLLCAVALWTISSGALQMMGRVCSFLLPTTLASTPI